MIKIIILVVVYFTFPLIIIYMCKRWTFFKKLGSIVLAYGFGLILGTSGIIPKGSDGYHLALQGRVSLPDHEIETLLSDGRIIEDDLFVNSIANAQDALTTVVVPLALPLLLFSLNVRRWLRYAKTGFLSMILALVSVVLVITAGYFIFGNIIPDSWKVAGMLVGVYTGGTPNLASLKVALDVDPNLFLMTNTYDIVIGAVTIIFFLTAGPRVFRAILPPFRKPEETANIDGIVAEAESFEDFSGMFEKKRVLPLLKALGISVVIAGVSAGIAMLFPKSSFQPVAILSITTLAILCSLVPWLNRIEKTFQLGMYLVLVFSFAVASMANLSAIFTVGFLGLLGYILFAYYATLLIHLLLSKIFRVNADDYLITTTAFIYSPPFVPVVAAALKNKDVIITGITVGIIGYILGNYLGVGLGFFLKGF